jgi:hypothetical protein
MVAAQAGSKSLKKRRSGSLSTATQAAGPAPRERLPRFDAGAAPSAATSSMVLGPPPFACLLCLPSPMAALFACHHLRHARMPARSKPAPSDCLSLGAAIVCSVRMHL